MVGTAIAAVLLICIFWMAGLSTRKSEARGPSFQGRGRRVAVVEIEGAIYDSGRAVKQIKHYGKDRGIKALVLRIDSPGGGVAASQEIYEAVRRVREAGKPVVASMGSVAASGGYYIACGADTIMAAPGTTTGSIGVIVELMDAENLLRKIGVRIDVVKSGPYKDTGSPHRSITPGERRYLQAWIDDAYGQFVDMVAAERGMDKREILKVADGRVFTGRQALASGLVDTLGYFDDAVSLAGRMAGIEGEPEIVRERQRRITWLDLLLEETRTLLQNRGGYALKYSWQAPF